MENPNKEIEKHLKEINNNVKFFFYLTVITLFTSLALVAYVATK